VLTNWLCQHAPEQTSLIYSQEQLASYQLQPAQIQDALNAHNVPYSGGATQINGINLDIEPSDEFISEDQIGNVVVARNEAGLPVYLRSLVDMQRGYQYPPRFLGSCCGYNNAGAGTFAVFVPCAGPEDNQMGTAGKTASRAVPDSRLKEWHTSRAAAPHGTRLQELMGPGKWKSDEISCDIPIVYWSTWLTRRKY
jgi:hypothetical protein